MLKSYVATRALIRNKDKFLILKSRNSGENDNSIGWETPGGRLEEGEEIMDGLNRELAEETGLKVNILFSLCTYSGILKTGEAIVYINYLCDYISGDVKIDENEHSRFMWATIEQIGRLTKNSGLQKEIKAYQEFIGRCQNK